MHELYIINTCGVYWIGLSPVCTKTSSVLFSFWYIHFGCAKSLTYTTKTVGGALAYRFVLIVSRVARDGANKVVWRSFSANILEMKWMAFESFVCFDLVSVLFGMFSYDGCGILWHRMENGFWLTLIFLYSKRILREIWFVFFVFWLICLKILILWGENYVGEKYQNILNNRKL